MSGLEPTEYETIEVEPITANIGAIVHGVDLREPLSGDQRAELRDALLRHLVLIVRDQDLTDEQHIAAASAFGVPNVFPVTRARGLDQPLEWIEDNPDSPPKTDLWHTDAAFLAEPPEIAMLNMRMSPPVGGDTMWSNLYAAHDSLSPTFQTMIESLEQDVHPGEYFRRSVELQFGPGVFEQVEREFSGARHPLVRVHPETGRRALFLCGEYVRGIAGMTVAESALLYEHLRRRLDDPNVQCRWRWRQFDVAIWDERCTNHRGLSDHGVAHRLVRRCTVGAAKPFGVHATG